MKNFIKSFFSTAKQKASLVMSEVPGTLQSLNPFDRYVKLGIAGVVVLGITALWFYFLIQNKKNIRAELRLANIEQSLENEKNKAFQRQELIVANQAVINRLLESQKRAEEELILILEQREEATLRIKSLEKRIREQEFTKIEKVEVEDDQGNVTVEERTVADTVAINFAVNCYIGSINTGTPLCEGTLE